jgi:hypothetical protein
MWHDRSQRSHRQGTNDCGPDEGAAHLMQANIAHDVLTGVISNALGSTEI